jgi:iron complex transport system substrate-binding protein
MGETKVPSDPKRVVALDSGELDIAIALGVPPVGATVVLPGADFLSYLKDKISGATPVGAVALPDLDAIAKLQPDLILSNKMRHEAIYQQLSAIAPTVFSARTGVSWQENLLLCADALNRKDGGQALRAGYEKAVADLKSARAGVLAADTVAILRFFDATARAYAAGSFSGAVLSDVGVKRPVVEQREENYLGISKETLSEVDADILLISRYGNTAAFETAFKADPEWPMLRAVERGAVYDIDDDLWMFGVGPLAAGRILDDLGRFLK